MFSPRFFVSTDEFVQYEGSDAALVGVRGLWFAVGWCRRVDRLLAADGGGDRPAAEPDHRGQDGAALRPLEGLLRGRSVAPSCHYLLIMLLSCFDIYGHFYMFIYVIFFRYTF